MGMHHGLIAATASQDDLLGELNRHVSRLSAGAPIDSLPSWIGGMQGRASELAMGEHNKRAYLFDPTFLLSGSPDMLVRMSASLGLIVAGGAETTSGSPRSSMTVSH